MVTVTREPFHGSYLYRLRVDGLQRTARTSSHRFPLALVTPDGWHMLLIPQSQAHRADPSRLLVTVTDGSNA